MCVCLSGSVPVNGFQWVAVAEEGGEAPIVILNGAHLHYCKHPILRAQTESLLWSLQPSADAFEINLFREAANEWDLGLGEERQGASLPSAFPPQTYEYSVCIPWLFLCSFPRK